MIDVERWRSEFPVCERVTYLNTGYSGPSPTPVVAAIKERLEVESVEGTASPTPLVDGRDLTVRTRATVAGLLGASVDEVCLAENTTEGINIVVNGLPWADGDEIVTYSLEHTSTLIPALFLQRRRGVRVRVVELAPDEHPGVVVEKTGAALSPRTRLLLFSHVQYSSGLRMPVAELRALTRDRSVPMLVDGAQAVGQLAVDVRALDVDYYALAGHKWLLGPDGGGALYVRRDHVAGLEPAKVAMHSAVVQPEGWRLEPEVGAITKFQLTSGSVALRAGLSRAIEFVGEVGVGEIEARNAALAADLKERLNATRGVTVLTPMAANASTGLVTFRVEGAQCQHVSETLWAEWRIVTRFIDQTDAVRVSLHFFNTEEEVRKTANAVAQIAATGR